MRRLILMRHAKTERSNASGDHARRLVERGRTDARLIADYLQTLGLQAAAALVSDAARTRETASLMQPALADGAQVIFREKLYRAEAEDILHEIWAMPASLEPLLVVGHNPGMHELAHILTGHGVRRLRSELVGKFPTGATVVIEFQGNSWTDAMPGTGTITHFVMPKSLRGADTQPSSDFRRRRQCWLKPQHSGWPCTARPCRTSHRICLAEP